jgi:hypothetical protein
MNAAVKFYRDTLDLPLKLKGVRFSMPPTKQNLGFVLAQFLDSEAKTCSVAQQ